jgi:large-conductance mechanosensitive channel
MRPPLGATLGYALERQLLVLYGVVFVGLALRNWNVLEPLFAVIWLLPDPFRRLVIGLGAFLTEVAGFLLVAVGLVAILKTVVDDSLATAERRSQP